MPSALLTLEQCLRMQVLLANTVIKIFSVFMVALPLVWLVSALFQHSGTCPAPSLRFLAVLFRADFCIIGCQGSLCSFPYSKFMLSCIARQVRHFPGPCSSMTALRLCATQMSGF